VPNKRIEGAMQFDKLGDLVLWRIGAPRFYSTREFEANW